MSDDIIGQGANSVDGAGAASTGEQAGSREDQEKKYTDADVDRIVAKKIAAERSKAAKQQNERRSVRGKLRESHESIPRYVKADIIRQKSGKPGRRFFWF